MSSRGGAAAARRAHNPKVGGSNPSPATKLEVIPEPRVPTTRGSFFFQPRGVAITSDQLLDALPPNLPPDLRAFLECTGDVATIANGPVPWVEIPANVRGMLGGATHPDLQVSPGSTPSTAMLLIKAGWVSATLTATVTDGRLSIDTSKLPMLAPSSIAREIRAFVDALNGRLASNGKALGAPAFGPAGMTLTKVSIAG